MIVFSYKTILWALTSIFSRFKALVSSIYFSDKAAPLLPFFSVLSLRSTCGVGALYKMCGWLTPMVLMVNNN